MVELKMMGVRQDTRKRFTGSTRVMCMMLHQRNGLLQIMESKMFSSLKVFASFDTYSISLHTSQWELCTNWYMDAVSYIQIVMHQSGQF